MTKLISTKRTETTLRPELKICPGPLILGEPGLGSFGELYGAVWSLGLYEDGPQLVQLRDDWEDRADTEALEGLGLDARHIGLAFDQAARPVVTWASDSGVSVRQWDSFNSRYVTRSIPGASQPLLLADTLCGVPLSDSDVVLFAVQNGNLSTYLQRENYEQARPLKEIPGDLVLDQIVSTGSAWQIFGELDGSELILLSEDYPVVVGNDLQSEAVPITAGLFESVIQVVVLPSSDLDAQVEPILSGELLDVAPKTYDVFGKSDLQVNASGILSGEVELIVKEESLGNDLESFARGPLSANAERVVIAYQTFDDIEAVANPIISGVMYE